ncbi:MAG: hypothetical protein OHK0022_26330 [Roseiflexaceae bacterium]
MTTTYRPFDDNDEYRRMLDDLLQKLDAVPSFLRDPLIEQLQPLINSLQNSRFPRFAIVGRRGSGKTMLMRALFQEPVGAVGAIRPQTGATSWSFLEGADGRGIHLLDTRGLQESRRPAEADSATTPYDSILAAIDNTPPDVILFLVKAKDVNTAIDGDLQALVRLLKSITTTHGITPAVLGVITQCDELDPTYVRSPRERLEYPEQWEAKQTLSKQAAEDLKGHLQRYADIITVKVISVIAALEFDSDRRVIPERDYRWNINELATLLFEALPEHAHIQFARVARIHHLQEKVARNIVKLTAAAAATVGLSPIPVSDMPILNAIQLFMVMTIAYISGRPFSLQSTAEMLAAMGINIGTGVALREVARALLKLIPGVGSVVSAGVAASGTLAIGEAAITYFIKGKNTYTTSNKTA